MYYATAQNSSKSQWFTSLLKLNISKRLSYVSLILVVCVVVLGAYTRLVDAGLGCPDWPGCYGHLTWPSSDRAIAAAEARFPEFPVLKDKTWPEMVHRYFASTLGLVILLIFALSVWQKKKGLIKSNTLPLVLLIAVIVQGLFGMWTVTLKLWPQVVTAHLLGGFSILSLLWLHQLQLRNFIQSSGENNKLEYSSELDLGLESANKTLKKSLHQETLEKILQPVAVIVLCLCILQISLGAWTAANYAALACPDLPKCHGQWLPQSDFRSGFNVFQDIGPNYLGGLLDGYARTAIHLSHRIGALILTLACSLLFLVLWFRQKKTLAFLLGTSLVIQLALGVWNVLGALPLPVAVAHNAGGAFLLLVLIKINYHLVKSNSKNLDI